MVKKLNNKLYGEVMENVIKRLVREGFYDEDDEMDPFEEYEQNYPNGDFDVSDMTADDLAKWGKNVGDFLFIYKGIRGWSIMNANTDSIIYDIVSDLYNCSHIEPTHEMDYLLYSRQREFRDFYVCVFKVIGTKDGDYYIIYEESKQGESFNFDESFKRKKKKMDLNENYKNRRQVSRNEIIDVLNASDDSSTNNGKFASITYIVPQAVYKQKNWRGKLNWRKNDVQSALDKYKERGEEDWYRKLSDYNQKDDMAKDKNPISTVIVTQRYVLHWISQKKWDQEYADYSSKLHDLRMKNGIALQSDGMLGDNHNQRQKLSYGGQINQTGKLSRDFNVAGSKITKTAYFCDENGHVISELPTEVVDSMIAVKKERGPEASVTQVLSGSALDAYVQAKKELDKTFRTQNFVFDRILCIAANVNGESYYYINDKVLSPTSKGGKIDVNQSDLVKIAEEQLGETFNEI